jgi:site-specific recombinase XerD
MNVSLKQGYDLFIFDRETYCKDTTISNYRNTLKYFLDYIVSAYNRPLEDIDLEELSLQDLQGYVLMLRKREKLITHPFKPTEHKPITNTSIRTYCIDLRTFFHFLYNNEYMEHDLMKRFRLIKREKKVVLPLFAHEVDEIDKMFNLKTCTGLRNYCVVHLMLDQGMRSGEVCNLNVADVNFDQNHIYVRGKGDKDRIVPLVSKVKRRLYEYLTLYRPYTGSEIFLCSVNGTYTDISQDSIKSLFSRIRSKTGIKRLKPHLLRHTFATSFLLGGGDMESLRLYMGHASYETTQNYLHLADLYNRMGTEIYRLDKIFFKRYY